MSRKAFLAGIPVLLNFCASENFKDVKQIYWIEIHSVNSKKKVSMDYENNLIMANIITNFFGYKLIKSGRYNFDQDNYQENFDYIDDLPIEEGDVISENVSMFRTKKFIGVKVQSFPEGAATFNQLYNFKRIFLNLPMTGIIRKLYNRCRNKNSMFFSKKWLIPDSMNLSYKYIKYMDEYDVLSYQNIKKNYKNFYKFLDRKYHLKEIFGKEKIYIHPIVPVYPLNQYLKWINLIKTSIDPYPLILKRHPADFRNFNNIFKNFRILSPFLSTIPLEVFFSQDNMYYVGYHSTTLLTLNPSKVKIVEPFNQEIMNSKKMHFHGLRGLFIKEWKKYWEI
jgi:hypothetical protein